jgi:antitoxin StbD
MDEPYHPPVRPVSEAREELSRALVRFRNEGAAAEPIIFGSHRKPEGAIIPFEVYTQVAAYLRRRLAADEAIASVRAEVQAEFSSAFKADLELAVEGEISPDDLYTRTLDRHRQRGSA